MAELLTQPALFADGNGRVLYLNSAFARLLGGGTGDVTGRELGRLPGLPGLSSVLRRHRTVRTGWRDRVRFQDPRTGGKQDLDVSGCFLRDIGGHDSPVCVVLLSRPIEAGTLGPELRSRMRHQILTPLTSVMGFAELLLADKAREREREFLAIIRDEAGRVTEYLEEILAERSG